MGRGGGRGEQAEGVGDCWRHAALILMAGSLRSWAGAVLVNILSLPLSWFPWGVTCCRFEKGCDLEAKFKV